MTLVAGAFAEIYRGGARGGRGAPLRAGARARDASRGARGGVARPNRARSDPLLHGRRRTSRRLSSSSEHGYREVRRFWDMAIDLADEPAEPAAVESRPSPRMTRAASTPPRGGVRGSLGAPSDVVSTWWERQRAQPNYDPSLWFLIRDGDEVVASHETRCAQRRLCRSLGVRRAWRGRGYGQARSSSTASPSSAGAARRARARSRRRERDRRDAALRECRDARRDRRRRLGETLT